MAQRSGDAGIARAPHVAAPRGPISRGRGGQRGTEGVSRRHGSALPRGSAVRRLPACAHALPGGSAVRRLPACAHTLSRLPGALCGTQQRSSHPCRAGGAGGARPVLEGLSGGSCSLGAPCRHDAWASRSLATPADPLRTLHAPALLPPPWAAGARRAAARALVELHAPPRRAGAGVCDAGGPVSAAPRGAAAAAGGAHRRVHRWRLCHCGHGRQPCDRGLALPYPHL